MQLPNKDEFQHWIANHPNVKYSVLGVLLIAFAYPLVDSMGDEAAFAELDNKFNSAQQAKSLFDIEHSVSDIDKGDAKDVVSEMARQMEEKTRNLEQQYEAEKQDIKVLQENYSKIESKLFETNQMLETLLRDGQGDRTRRAPKRSKNKEPINDPSYRLPGSDDTYARSNSSPNQLNSNQTEIITRPSIIKGKGIRLITQRTVRELRADGSVDMRRNEMNMLSSADYEIESGDSSNALPQINQSVQDSEFTLAMGSIISGTLINGVAAPTNVGRQDEPTPILMRIKREAIMPNHFSLDIRECHLLGAAIGKLATSRVLIRAEAISCIREDGKALEQTIKAYAVSSTDGLAGIRGEIVERSSKVLGNVMRAGFWGGFAQAAAPSQVQSLNTNPTTEALYQTQNLNRYVGSGALKGAADTFDRLAQYYLAMAEEIWPVVELLPAIEVDFIVQRGMTMRLQGEPQPIQESDISEVESEKAEESYSLSAPSIDSIKSLVNIGG